MLACWDASWAAIGTATCTEERQLESSMPHLCSVIDWAITVLGATRATTNAGAHSPPAHVRASLPFRKDIVENSPVLGIRMARRRATARRHLRSDDQSD